ncbi:MAG: hypothetical protein J7J36_00715 [Thermoplasmata archaeon]|nr:hypothetical protein [Thermoplasmata archaeon]
MPENIFLNPNEPNPAFMVYKEDARKILLKIIGSKSDCFWLLGKTGMGKTTFLLWMNKFAPIYKIKPIFFHGGDDLKFEDFKEKIEKNIRPSFFSRVFFRKKYTEIPVAILIDEVEYVKDDNIWKYIISKLDESELHLSIVMASVEVVEDLKKYFKGRDIEKIQLEKPPMDIMLEMIRKRIEAGGGEDFQPFGKQLVKDIIESSDTIRDILIRLQEVAK